LDRHIAGASARYWVAERDQGLEGLAFSIEGLSRTRSEVLARIEYLDGSTATHRLTPDEPGHQLAEKPSALTTAWTYFILGVEHIIFGIDHLLFVFVLLLLVNNTRKLITTITAFTIAHSITLILAALGHIWVPVPPVEACIALSIVFVATEIIRAQQGRAGITEQRPWLVAFSFGLLHGLGFAAALGEIGLPQSAIATALLVFNVGVEAGQLLFVIAVLGIWRLAKNFSAVENMPQWCYRVPPYAIGSLAAFWSFERVASFWT
ncbi:MAG: HupE/UreJ family protein, partial [Pseudomonadales bacterium]|nr:HupE/UreJ family protein [Pseudomonadales bacterium]